MILNVTRLCVKFLSNNWMGFSMLKSKLYRVIGIVSISGNVNPIKNDLKKNFLLGKKLRCYINLKKIYIIKK